MEIATTEGHLRIFGLNLAERLSGPIDLEEELPAKRYLPYEQCFSYEFQGQEYTAKQLVDQEVPHELKQTLRNMATTKGKTGKRDVCYI